MSLQIFKSIPEWRAFRQSDAFKNKSIGYVATMGNLHTGHQSLLERSARENDITVLSIFINPSQFNDPNDLKNYPRTFEADIEIAKQSKTTYVLSPPPEEIYADNYTYKVVERDFSQKLCGKYREGHFDGVLTVVMKWFMLVKPHKAYFGEKDYQQLQLIKDMVKTFFIDIDVVPCPTTRDQQDLALSSRNRRLTPEQIELARQFPKLLEAKLPLETIKENLEKLGFSVDYIEEYNGRRFGAVHLGPVRLIDNMQIPS